MKGLSCLSEVLRTSEIPELYISKRDTRVSMVHCEEHQAVTKLYSHYSLILHNVVVKKRYYEIICYWKCF
jgi:hypothetical protein